MEISFAVWDFGGSATCQCAQLGSESSFTEIQSTKNNKFSEGRKAIAKLKPLSLFISLLLMLN